MAFGRQRFLVPFIIVLFVGPALAGCVAQEAKEPSKVTNLRVEQVPEGARLSWTEFPAGVAAEYNVYRGGRVVGSAQAPLRTFLDQTVAPDTQYTYWVTSVDGNDAEGPVSNSVTFVFTRSLALIQDESVSRGFVNLSVVEVSPGVRWSDLRVTLAGTSLERNDGRYVDRNAAWTHSSPRDELSDLGEKMRIYAPSLVRLNATLQVRLVDNTLLFEQDLAGRPNVNFTLHLDRNVTVGLGSWRLDGVGWRDNGRNVTDSYAGLVARWSSLDVFVDGVKLDRRDDGRTGSWTHDVPADDVIRPGNRLIVRATELQAGSVVTVRDAVAGVDAFVAHAT